jgi:hypothetical protein
VGLQQDALLPLFFTFALEHAIRKDQENQKELKWTETLRQWMMLIHWVKTEML